jgi:hypothetical protein
MPPNRILSCNLFANSHFTSKVVDICPIIAMGEWPRKFERDLSRARTRNASKLPFSRADKPVQDRIGYSALSCFGPHRDELFRCCRMDSDRRIELCFGRAAVDRNGQPLNNFSRFRPDHVAAKHSVAGAVDY